MARVILAIRATGSIRPARPFPGRRVRPTLRSLTRGGTITGTASVGTLVLIGDSLTSTLQVYAAVLALDGTVNLLGPSYSNISDEVEEVGNSTVTMSRDSELYINNTAAGMIGSTAIPFDVGVSSGYLSTFNLTGAGTAVIVQHGSAVIGDAGDGAMTISAGAQLVTKNSGDTSSIAGVILGAQAGSEGTLVVTGQSSLLQSGKTITVGDVGSGVLQVLAGGEVSTSQLNVAAQLSSNGVVLVQGSGSQLYAGSAWIGSSYIYAANTTASLTISAGGFAGFSDYLTIGSSTDPRATSSVTVQGSGSTLEVGASTPDSDGSLVVGAGVGSSSLQVASGGHVLLSNLGYVTVGEGDNPCVISVSGTGSLLSGNSGIYSIGEVTTGTIAISSGGRVITSGGSNIQLGFDSPYAYGVATIAGIGSSWAETGEFDVGYQHYGTLLVEDGGSLSIANYNGNGGFIVGDEGPDWMTPTGSVGTATITGAGSTLTNNGQFVVGLYGSGTLTISSGAVVTTMESNSYYYGAIVGEYAGSTGTVTVTGGSEWKVATTAIVGFFGNGALTIGAGSTVTAAALAVGGSGTGTINVSGAGAKLAVAGNAGFGDGTNVARVTIGSGGTVSMGGTADLERGSIQLSGGALTVAQTLTVYEGQLLSGFGTIQAASLINASTVYAGGGTLSFIGGITGTGRFEIEAASTLSLSGSVGSGQEMVFYGADGNLVLGTPASFAGVIDNFTNGDTIDLSQVIAGSLSYSGQTLTVHETSGASLGLTFSGAYAQSSFALAADGHGGTLIKHS